MSSAESSPLLSPSSADEWPILPSYQPPPTTRLDHLIAHTPSIDITEANDRRFHSSLGRTSDRDNSPPSPQPPRASLKRKNEEDTTVPPFIPTFRGGGEDVEEEGDEAEEDRLSRVPPDELYDPTSDDVDVRELQADHAAPSGGRVSDGVLSCPHCFTTLCLDCQRHTRFPHQYRAMFVQRCITQPQRKVTPTLPPKTGRKKRGKGNDDEEERGVEYSSVCCEECGTEVGAVEKGGGPYPLYHFFHVLDSAGG